MKKSVSNAVKITIRRFRDSDAKALSGLIVKTLRTTSAKYYQKRFIDYFVRRRSPKALKELSGKTTIFVALSGKRIVGTVNLSPIGGVGSLFVHPSYQSRKVGSKLVCYLLRQARKRRLKRVRGNSAINAVEFYRKLGFKVGRKTVYKKKFVTYRVTYVLK
jgi:GNAT superfamily N-acetyltransferase